jgi:hypothetical protein
VPPDQFVHVPDLSGLLEACHEFLICGRFHPIIPVSTLDAESGPILGYHPPPVPALRYGIDSKPFTECQLEFDRAGTTLHRQGSNGAENPCP